MMTKINEKAIGYGLNTKHDNLVEDEKKENKDKNHEQITKKM